MPSIMLTQARKSERRGERHGAAQLLDFHKCITKIEHRMATEAIRKQTKYADLEPFFSTNSFVKLYEKQHNIEHDKPPDEHVSVPNVRTSGLRCARDNPWSKVSFDEPDEAMVFETYKDVESEVWCENTPGAYPARKMHLSTDNFWNYVYSNEWVDVKVLRVTEGGLLDLILHYLNLLSHSRDLIMCRLSGYQTHLPIKPTQDEQTFQSERMNVRKEAYSKETLKISAIYFSRPKPGGTFAEYYNNLKQGTLASERLSLFSKEENGSRTVSRGGSSRRSEIPINESPSFELSKPKQRNNTIPSMKFTKASNAQIPYESRKLEKYLQKKTAGSVLESHKKCSREQKCSKESKKSISSYLPEAGNVVTQRKDIKSSLSHMSSISKPCPSISSTKLGNSNSKQSVKSGHTHQTRRISIVEHGDVRHLEDMHVHSDENVNLKQQKSLEFVNVKLPTQQPAERCTTNLSSKGSTETRKEIGVSRKLDIISRKSSFSSKYDLVHKSDLEELLKDSVKKRDSSNNRPQQNTDVDKKAHSNDELPCSMIMTDVRLVNHYRDDDEHKNDIYSETKSELTKCSRSEGGTKIHSVNCPSCDLHYLLQDEQTIERDPLYDWLRQGCMPQGYACDERKGSWVKLVQPQPPPRGKKDWRLKTPRSPSQALEYRLKKQEKMMESKRIFLLNNPKLWYVKYWRNELVRLDRKSALAYWTSVFEKKLLSEKMKKQRQAVSKKRKSKKTAAKTTPKPVSPPQQHSLYVERSPTMPSVSKSKEDHEENSNRFFKPIEPRDFAEKLFQSLYDFVIRKEEITTSFGFYTVKSLTIERKTVPAIPVEPSPKKCAQTTCSTETVSDSVLRNVASSKPQELSTSSLGEPKRLSIP